MAIAKVMEISSESAESFEDAVRQGIHRASRTVDQIKSAWVKEQKVVVENGQIAAYRVYMNVTFVLRE